MLFDDISRLIIVSYYYLAIPFRMLEQRAAKLHHPSGRASCNQRLVERFMLSAIGVSYKTRICTVPTAHLRQFMEFREDICLPLDIPVCNRISERKALNLDARASKI